MCFHVVTLRAEYPAAAPPHLMGRKWVLGLPSPEWKNPWPGDQGDSAVCRRRPGRVRLPSWGSLQDLQSR